MTTMELTEHPELSALVAAIRNGEVVEIVDHGFPVARMVSPPQALAGRFRALQRRFRSAPHPGSEVVDMRQESDR